MKKQWTKEKCESELGKARERMTSGKLKYEHYAGLIRGLGIMLLHCPGEMVIIVQATHREAVKRQSYAMLQEAKEAAGLSKGA